MQIAERMKDIAPFHVMELMQRAQMLEAQGRSIIRMEVGEPDFPTPPLIVEAAQRFIADGRVFYTSALGLPALREAIAQDYLHRFGVEVAAERIIVTSGASAALIMALAATVNPGDEILMADPGYPCNRHFTRLFEGTAGAIPVSAATNFQPTAQLVADHWRDRTRGVMLASPANPTGTLVPPDELRAIHGLVQRRQGTLIVDEIYQGLTYGVAPSTALALGDDVIVINSFSKYFGMTGWRLGWMVVPKECVREVEKLAQNLYISPPAPAQHAALAAFHPDTLAELETRRLAFKARRDLLLEGLIQAGIAVPVKPEGAFYLYGDVSSLTTNSFDFAMELLQKAGVAATPGLDFGQHQPERYIRFAYTVGPEKLAEGVERIKRYLAPD
ncbi:MAG: pyridoxal phosphate-dependent aminotransferase [Rhodocyclaceae bacterium]|nr:MAG: pyridoxal phosphate-dependent aminotransferase [Rhodocyclaceae bacterium]